MNEQREGEEVWSREALWNALPVDDSLAPGTTAPLTFDEVSEVSRERSKLWHGDNSKPWSGADWGNAMMGEVGELAEAVEALVLMNALTKAGGNAANVVKKLQRKDTGVQGNADPGREALVQQLEDEAADVFFYLDLLLDHYGTSLPVGLVRKFNAISDREGLPHRIRSVI